VASSRRRERELARRRYERRRLREQQLRAKRRRRNTIVGATAGTIAVVAAVVVLAVHLAGGSSKPTASPSATPTPTASTTPPPQAVAAKQCAPISPNPPAAGQPKIPDWTQPVPSKLVTKDIKTGSGPVIKKGDAVTVDYIGIGCSTGKVFDATYLHPTQPLTVTVGTAQVIPGFDEGLVGMHEGGTRELVIPASLAYGSTGSGASIGPNAPLIFVVRPSKASGG
jgi:peptidylprolyl isomerase